MNQNRSKKKEEELNFK